MKWQAALVFGPLFAVEVSGDSMQPTYAAGDWLLCRRARRLEPGDVGVIAHPVVGLVVKRVAEVRPDDSLWLHGDNPDPAASTDSRTWGWLPGSDIRGKVWFRYRRGNGNRRPVAR